MPEPVLSFEGLTVCFATDSGPVAAVNDVSYQVFPGEVLAVVGESGSGKSVSSRTAMGLLPPTATVRGTVVLGTKAVTKMSERELTALRGGAISMVFQEPGAALDPLFTVGFQIGEALRAHSGMKRKAARAKAIELLRAVGLPDPEAQVDYYPHQLSGGQKQRVVIAIAIACEPKVIIADEPTTALDVTVQAEILELLRDLCDRIGAAIVLITHNMGVVADLADRVVVMREGKIVEEAPVDRLFAEPQHEYTRALLAAVPKLHVLPDNWEADEATDSAPVAGAALAKTIVREPIPADAETVLEVSNLVVEFPAPLGRPAFRAVDDVTLSLRRGETLGLVGESGSGKSTIGRCVAALQRPTAGSVRVLGTDIAGLSERNLRPIRRRFGFVFQDPATSLNPRLTIGECVAEPLLVHKEAKGRPPANASVTCSTTCSSRPVWKTATRTSFRAVSASASAWPAPWSCAPTCSWPTNPPAPWTSRSRPRCSSSSPTCSANAAGPACSSATTSPWWISSPTGSWYCAMARWSNRVTMTTSCAARARSTPDDWSPPSRSRTRWSNAVGIVTKRDN